LGKLKVEVVYKSTLAHALGIKMTKSNSPNPSRAIEARKKWNRKALNWEKRIRNRSDIVNFESGFERYLKCVEGFLSSETLSYDYSTPAIDVGCGTGAVALCLSKYLSNVYALDISDEMIKIGRRQTGEHGVRFLMGDALSLPFPSSLFQLVCTRGILISHFGTELDELLIYEFSRVLMPAGFVIFDFLTNIDPSEKEIQDKSIYNRNQINSLLVQYGLSLVEYTGETWQRVNAVIGLKKRGV